jgi:transglutaminase-like putative cysteine protease
MKRRDFLRSAGMVSAAMAFPKVGRTFVQGTAPEAWRTFDVTTQIWMPTALLNPTPFQKTLANDFKAEGGTAKLVEGGTDSLGIITAEFPSGVMPVLTVTSRVTTKNFAVDLSAPSKAPKEDPAELKHFLRATKLIPTDGIVRATATEITKDSNTDVEKARAIYEWIVENTTRNPKTRGCGL